MPERNEIIINNLLSQICDFTEITKEQYLPWLKTEIGLTNNEILHLKEMNCLPEPA